VNLLFVCSLEKEQLPTSNFETKMPAVEIIVGNSYNKLPDKSGNNIKIHDWTLFVDVINNGDPDVIDRVFFDFGPNFSPKTHISANPVLIKQHNGRTTAWRFKTKQQTYGNNTISACIRIRGAGGTIQEVDLNTQLRNNAKLPVRTFVENLEFRKKKPLKIKNDQNFGIELEITSANSISEDDIASKMNNNTSTFVEVIRNYRAGKVQSSNWKIVPDSSIVCSITSPDCNRFELVSPILTGGVGLVTVHKILKQLEYIQPKLKVNKSMGFHLHIDITKFSHSQLVKICQNFIKYESLIDTFMPKSRRSGSVESDKFFKSNRKSVADQVRTQRGNGKITNGMCHKALQMTENNDELVQLMNGNSRYYKLNLTNLTSGRQPTIEFRQHSATLSYDKVSHWVRFCVAFCNNSANLPPPVPFSDSRNLDFKFNALFQDVIQDRALKGYYQERRANFEKEGRSCCSGCVSGDSCSVKRRRRV
jgi:hypothetical protein